MCRVLVYGGHRLPIENLLYKPSSSLVHQVTDPQQLGVLNLGGFGLEAWDPLSTDPGRPWRYRSTTLPTYDENLRHLAAKLEATTVLAHVRGIPYDVRDGDFGPQNLHPFRYPGYRWSMAHNGFLRGFSDYRQDLMTVLRPEVAAEVRGTTDSEAIYALVMSQLEHPTRAEDLDELVEALVKGLRLLRRLRVAHGQDISSSVNLFFTNGRDTVATRFAFDFGRYPLEVAGEIAPTTIRYLSLWYTLGERFEEVDGSWCMTGDPDSTTSSIIASEPLTLDRTGWTEVPEYTVLTVRAAVDRHDVNTLPLDA